MHVIAGHTLEVDEQECLLLNEFDDEYRNFCKVYNFEERIKQMARDFPESYHIGIFAGQDKTKELD